MKYKSVAIFLILFGVQSCGSGSGGESNPVGLFTDPPADASVTLPSDGSAQDAMSLFNSQLGGIGMTLEVLSISKSFTFRENPNCTQTDSSTLECNHNFRGPDGGPSTEKQVFICEDTDKGGSRCNVSVTLNFGGFLGPDRCQKRTREIRGIFHCNLTHVGEPENETTAISHFSGQCNTQDNSNENNQMVLKIDGRTVRVGFDLGVEFEEKVGIRETRLNLLRDMNLHGMILVDGVSYSFETLKNINLGQCP